MGKERKLTRCALLNGESASDKSARGNFFSATDNDPALLPTKQKYTVQLTFKEKTRVHNSALFASVVCPVKRRAKNPFDGLSGSGMNTNKSPNESGTFRLHVSESAYTSSHERKANSHSSFSTTEIRCISDLDPMYIPCPSLAMQKVLQILQDANDRKRSSWRWTYPILSTGSLLSTLSKIFKDGRL